MNGGEVFVLAIIVIVIGGRIIQHYMGLQHAKPQQNPEDQSRINALEDRVRTLERIVTDKGYDLKREFDKL
ncbi:MAG: hypothetical protein L0H70_06430 [Xanthomonadales bacterium]|nr:hypothetical protein [Xanthomonadales bacterium]